jgi:hypothetical protein
VNGALTLGGAAGPTGNVTVGTTGTINVSGTGSLTIAVDKTLTNNGTVALTNNGSLVLAGGAASTSNIGAKLTGAGTLTAGATIITGNWQAVMSVYALSKTITIKATGDTTAEIKGTDSNVSFKALAAGASITQLTGAGNNLTIGVDTEINLAGSGTAKTGEIVLAKKQVASDAAATIKLNANSAIIKAGSGGTIVSVTLANLQTGLINGDAKGVTIGNGILAYAEAIGASKLTQITGNAGNNTITGPDQTATANCVISSVLSVIGS